MDALEIMSNLDRVIPFFQPIFSADEHKIVGYEVLGRYADGNEIVSLGPFFQDKEVPEEYHLEVDHLLLVKALDLYVGEGLKKSLFINKDPKLLMKDYGEDLLHTLLSYEQKGLSLDCIVIEISEYHYESEIEHLLQYYKTHGIRIAIDHIGETDGNIHKVINCSPDILKINLSALRNETTSLMYKDILYSLSLLARKIGASLLFENIEVEYQLQYAWKHGGRYYQGYYLQRPQANFCDENMLKEKLRQKCQEFILHEKRSLEKVFLLADSIQSNLQSVLPKIKKQADSRIDLLRGIANRFEHMCFRLYICDENGFELSPNYFKKNGEWIVQPEYFNKNWSWRPYFLENIFKMRKDRNGLISDLYRDIEMGEMIRTFSYPVFENEYLFMDLSYDFLYDQDGLLYD
ncbi:EAL domain-containing protein (putative c-di-GMP-specific phosphodiesterase class I) [Oikeobacillus pervagus]|uniref:EAL domain-containing protein (Putative c-di-GMP-specific phosphodiesterase class I) n=1 Tax=Oikeobacillus pervagus TaxID=1325931 RepID=A0AAJ1T412_9BACI|nr:EAL domain-containing protein [Oikeobacillus pervagus]MDQ0214821.1 EAL domain-containing protein (putative c-di-GMP-specific phosphodiesterase class I) [Oikeobacillus pervagus]